MDGLDDLEADARSKRRSRGNRRGEITPPPRHPKPAEPAGEGTPAHGHTGVPVHPHTGTQALPYPDTPAPESADAPRTQAPPKAMRTTAPADEKRSTRPPSVEAYLTEDLMDWLWQVRGAGVAQRKDNVTSAVVRLALEDLRARKTPEQIIAALDQSPPPTKGAARGRRR